MANGLNQNSHYIIHDEIEILLFLKSIMEENANNLLLKQRVQLVKEVIKAYIEIIYHNCATIDDLKEAIRIRVEELKLKNEPE